MRSAQGLANVIRNMPVHMAYPELIVGEHGGTSQMGTTRHDARWGVSAYSSVPSIHAMSPAKRWLTSASVPTWPQWIGYSSTSGAGKS